MRHNKRHSLENATIKFGIAMSTWERPGDPEFRIPCVTSLTSIARQTFPHWTLFVSGDNLSSQSIGSMFAAFELAAIPRHKIVFRNLDHRLSERNIYSDKNKLLFSSGMNSAKNAIELAYSAVDITHIAKLDEDDSWSSDHLQNLAQAYAAVPLATFAFTAGRYHTGTVLPDVWPDASTLTMTQSRWTLPMNVSIMPPPPCHVIHAAVSWSIDLKLTYNTLETQEHPDYVRKLDRCCERECKGVLWADADLLSRVHGLVQENKIISVYAPRLDVFHTGHEDISCLLSVLYGSESKMSCSHVHGGSTDLASAVQNCKTM